MMGRRAYICASMKSQTCGDSKMCVSASTARSIVGSSRRTLERSEAELQRVGRPGVGVDDLVVDTRADPAGGLQIAQAFEISGVVVMALVGAHHQVVLAPVRGHVGQIIVGLARDVQALGLQRI